jgi:hypothetical protein
VNDSKREVFLHVESQHLSDWALPFTIWSLDDTIGEFFYHLISWWYQEWYYRRVLVLVADVARPSSSPHPSVTGTLYHSPMQNSSWILSGYPTMIDMIMGGFHVPCPKHQRPTAQPPTTQSIISNSMHRTINTRYDRHFKNH